VEEEPYLRELVRDLHLNPLWAQAVPTLRALDRFPWAGHSALLGSRPCAWQTTGAVLQQFGPTRVRAAAPPRGARRGGVCGDRLLPRGAAAGQSAGEGVAYLTLDVCGYPGSAVANLLGVRPSAVYRAAQRGRGTRKRWEKLLSAGKITMTAQRQRPV